MVGIAVVALLAWGGKLMAVRQGYGATYSMTYYVGDLLPPRSGPLTENEMTSVVVPLKTSVPRDGWSSGERSVTPFFLTSSVIVRDTKAGHAQIRAWLDQRRSRLKAQAN